MKILLTFLLLLSFAVLGSRGFEWYEKDASCVNGGTPTNTSDGTPTCNCLAYFKGDTCKTVLCLNQGYLVNEGDDRCVCPVGYYGLYCESYQQTPAQTDLFYVKSNDLIIFLNIRVDFPNDYYNTFLNYNKAVNDDLQNRNYDNYFLYEFDNDPNEGSTNNKPDAVTNTGNATGNRINFLAEFNKAGLSKRYNEASCQTEPIFKNLLPWIKGKKFSQKTITIFSYLPPDLDGFEELEQLAIAFKLQFNIYASYSEFLCDVDADKDKFSTFQLLAERTGGIYWPLLKSDTNLDKSLNLFVGSTTNLQRLGYQASGNCPSTLTQSFQSDLDFPIVSIIVKADGGTPVITSSNPNTCFIDTGSIISAPTSSPSTMSVTSSIYLNNVCTISVQNLTGACSIEVMGSPDKNSYQSARIYPSFTDTNDTDSAYFAMKSNVPQYIRLHLERIGIDSNALVALNVQLNSDCQAGSPIPLMKNPWSTFEFVSSSKTNCLAMTGDGCFATKHWLTVTYNVTKPQNTFTATKYIPVKCLPDNQEIPTKPPTSPAPIITTTEAPEVPTTVLSTTVTEQTTTEAPTTEAPTTEPPTTAEPTTTNAPTTAAPQETTAEASTALPTSFTCPPGEVPLPNMVVGYSLQYPPAIAQAFLAGPQILNDSIVKDNFGKFALFSIDNNDPTYSGASIDTFTSFLTAVSGAASGYTQGDQNAPTNVITILQGLLESTDVTDRSVILILVGKTDPNVKGTDAQITEILQRATSKQIRINFYMDKNLYLTEPDPSKFKFYEQVAAVSNGHFIITDITKYDGDGYIYSMKMFSMLFYHSSPHKLALSKITSIGQNIDDLGVLDLTAQSGAVDFYFSSFYSSYLNTSDSVFLVLIFLDAKTGATLAPVQFSSPFGNMGIWNESMPLISIPAGTSYNVTVFNTIQDQGSTIAYRLWQHWGNATEYKVITEFMHLVDEKYETPIPGPAYDIPAVPQISLSQFPADQIDNLEVEFYDCNGVYQYTLDHYNRATMLQSSSQCGTRFVVNPFACDFQQTCTIQNDILQGFYTTKYKIHTTSNTTFEYFTNFWCKKNDELLAGQCGATPTPTPHVPEFEDMDAAISTTDMPSTTDIPKDECMCLSRGPDHYRGPICKIPDCSNNGYLQFDEASSNFVCQCKDGYNGTYCAIGICSDTASRTAKDVKYRTFTIGIVYSAKNEFQNIVKEMNTIDTSTADKLKEIWQYNIFSICNGNLRTIYFGTSKADFGAQLTALTNVYDSDKYCGTDPTIDLTTIVRYGFQSYGKEVRGLLWLAAHNADIIGVSDINDYYRTIQGYRQEVFLTTVTGASDGSEYDNYQATLNAVMVTGGERLDLQTYVSSGVASYIQTNVEAKTSLNYYDLLHYSLSPITLPSLTIDKDGSQAFVTISNYGSYTEDLEVMGATCTRQFSSDTKLYVFSCTSPPSALEIKASLSNFSALITVRVLNGYTPAWIFVNETNQDNLESMPVVGSYPSIAFDFEDDISDVKDTTPDSIARQAPRENCAYKYTSTFQLPVTAIGYDYFKLTINGDSGLTKIIPYVVTDTLNGRCKNGDVTPGDAKCKCPSDWSGPDCSRPICQYGSINTMQNACYCDLTHSGPTCSQGGLLG